MLDEVPGRMQAVLISRAGSRGCPVRLEPGQGRRVKPRHGSTQRNRLPHRQRHNRLLAFHQRMAHDNHASPES